LDEIPSLFEKKSQYLLLMDFFDSLLALKYDMQKIILTIYASEGRVPA